MTLASVLVLSPEFILERELCNTSVLSSQSLQLKHKIELFAGRLRRNLKEWIYVTLKETSYNKIKQKHITCLCS